MVLLIAYKNLNDTKLKKVLLKIDKITLLKTGLKVGPLHLVSRNWNFASKIGRQKWPVIRELMNFRKR